MYTMKRIDFLSRTQKVSAVTLSLALLATACGGTPVRDAASQTQNTTPTTNSNPASPSSSTSTDTSTINLDPAAQYDFEYANGFPNPAVGSEWQTGATNNKLMLRVHADTLYVDEIDDYGTASPKSVSGNAGVTCVKVTLRVRDQNAAAGSGTTQTTAVIRGGNPSSSTYWAYMAAYGKPDPCANAKTYADLNFSSAIGGSTNLKVQVVDIQSTYAFEQSCFYRSNCNVSVWQSAWKSQPTSYGTRYHVHKGGRVEIAVNGTSFQAL